MRKLLDKDLAHAERCMRDLIALSTLPTLWLGADMLRIAESLAAALYATVDPDLVFVALRHEAGEAPLPVAQVDRYQTDPALAAALGPRLFSWCAEHDPDELLEMANPLGSGILKVAVRPVGFDAGLGVVAAGFARADAPSALQHTMLGIGATQAASAVQNAKLLRSLRESIAERERVEEALREAGRHKDEFIATLSHELRNPLAAMSTGLELLRARGVRLGELDMLVRQTAHLSRLVDDLLDVSRIARGKIELRRSRVEIAAALRQALEMATPLLRSRSQRVEMGAVAKGLFVDADPERLAQIVFNLLSNAAKYSDPGSAISVRAWREADRVLLSVRDNGVGISGDMLERVFEQFVQQEQTLARSDGGLGLGLTIVRGLVEMHGGKVSVFSAGLGQGSEFTIDLPAAPAACAASAPAREAAAVPSVSKRILVVDDNVDAGEALAQLLGLLGHEVSIVHDAHAALHQVKEAPPDVALIDIGLPGMDGCELAMRIRQECPHAPPRLIAVSGYGLERDRRRSAEAGFADHLVKPVDLTSLTRLVETSAPRAAPGETTPRRALR